MDGTLKHSEVVTIDTAIVLASSGVLDDGVMADGSPVSALTRVGGMTLFQRTLCTLQRGGIAHALILAGEEEPALRSLIRGDDRIRMALRWLSVREFPPWHVRTWETLTGEMRGACLILGCHIVCFPSLIAALREEGREGNAVVTVGQAGEQGACANQDRPEEANALASAVDPVVVPVRFFGTSETRRVPATGATSPVRLALERAGMEGAVRALSASPHGYQDIREPDGPRKAERLLFHALQHVRGSLDGMVDRYLNRKLSGWFSRLFLRLRCSPNVITVLSMVIGLMGAACFAMGSYPLGLLGAALFQFAVILDCCDGEVARLTFAESRFGEALDIMADNVVHMAIFAGVAWGVYQGGLRPSSPLPLIVGSIAIVANGVSVWGVQRVKSLKSHSGHWRCLSAALRSRLDFMLERVANRDFSVVVAVCACGGALSWFLWLGAVGSSMFAVLMAWNLRQALRLHPS